MGAENLNAYYRPGSNVVSSYDQKINDFWIALFEKFPVDMAKFEGWMESNLKKRDRLLTLKNLAQFIEETKTFSITVTFTDEKAETIVNFYK